VVATGRPAEPEQLTVDESDYGFEHGTTSITVDTERIEDEVQVYPVGGESSTAGGYFGRPNDTSKPRKPGPTVVGPGFGVALQLGSVPGMLTTEPVPSELPTASNCSNSERNSIKTPSREGDSPPTRRREPYCSSIRLRSAVLAEAYGAEPGCQSEEELIPEKSWMKIAKRSPSSADMRQAPCCSRDVQIERDGRHSITSA
jgi:hypothetical protein